MKKSQIGIKKNLPNGTNNVRHKYEDLKFNVGCSKNGGESEYSEFTLCIETEKQRIRLVLNKEDADHIMLFWKEQKC